VRWHAPLPPGGSCSGGNPRSGSLGSDDDGVVFPLLRASSWSNGSLERPTGGAVFLIYRIEDEGFRRRGALEIRRPMRGDGLAQEVDAFWRRGDVEGREASQGRCIDLS